MSKSGFISFKYGDDLVFGRNRFTAPFKMSESLINEARIVRILRGSSRLYTANAKKNLSAGDTFIMKADNFVNHWNATEGDDQCEIIAFNMSSELLHKIYAVTKPSWLSSSKSSSAHSLISLPSSIVLSAFFDSLSHYIDQPDVISQQMVELKVKELIELILRLDDSGAVTSLFSSLFTATEYRFQEVIQANLFETLSLDELAFLTNTSVSSFKRKFSQLYGTSPTKYFTSKRLEKAQELLETTDLRISDIAYEVGFSDTAHFSKTFKQYYHCSPSDFKK